MKVILFIGISVCFLGCLTPKPSAPPSKQPIPTTSNTASKSCEEVLEEEVSKGWQVYAAKTQFIGYIKNDNLNDKIIGQYKDCIVGKNRDYISKLFGTPSVTSYGILRYHCYISGETDLIKVTCLTFHMKDNVTVSSISLRECEKKM